MEGSRCPGVCRSRCHDTSQWRVSDCGGHSGVGAFASFKIIWSQIFFFPRAAELQPSDLRIGRDLPTRRCAVRSPSSVAPSKKNRGPINHDLPRGESDMGPTWEAPWPRPSSRGRGGGELGGRRELNTELLSVPRLGKNGEGSGAEGDGGGGSGRDREVLPDLNARTLSLYLSNSLSELSSRLFRPPR